MELMPGQGFSADAYIFKPNMPGRVSGYIISVDDDCVRFCGVKSMQKVIKGVIHDFSNTMYDVSSDSAHKDNVPLRHNPPPFDKSKYGAFVIAHLDAPYVCSISEFGKANVVLCSNGEPSPAEDLNEVLNHSKQQLQKEKTYDDVFRGLGDPSADLDYSDATSTQVGFGL